MYSSRRREVVLRESCDIFHRKFLTLQVRDWWYTPAQHECTHSHTHTQMWCNSTWSIMGIKQMQTSPTPPARVLTCPYVLFCRRRQVESPAESLCGSQDALSARCLSLFNQHTNLWTMTTGRGVPRPCRASVRPGPVCEPLGRVSKETHTHLYFLFQSLHCTCCLSGDDKVWSHHVTDNKENNRFQMNT